MDFTFTLTEEEANLVIIAIQKQLSNKLANPLIQKIQEQSHEQLPSSEVQ